MKKTSHPVITGIITAVILLAAFVSCGNLNSEKNSSIIVQLDVARSAQLYQECDVSYYIVTISPDPNGEGEVRFDRTKTSHAFEGLPSGKYTITVKAYNESNILVAEGSDEDIEVIPGETATAVVEMEAKTYHVHDFATEWTTDAAYHWHAATCGDTDEIRDKAEHTFGDWITVTPATEENEGLKKRTCTVCNYEETETIPLLNHTHTWAADWTYDESNHWHECTSASCTEKTQVEGHAWDNGTETPATCTEEGELVYKCEDCGMERREVLPKAEHVWTDYTYDENATETKPGTKTRTCLMCDEQESLPANGPNTATYQFTETVKKATGYSGSMESAGKTGEYVIFGDFPQTVAGAGVTFNPYPEKNGYYVGSDGCYYEKVLENAYNASLKYSDNSPAKQIGENSYRYFKVEPIIWRVITKTFDIDGSPGEATGALLFAENGLIAHVYNDSTGQRTIDSQTIKAANYEYSTIRAYLNGLDYINDSLEPITTYKDSNFLTKAFTPNAVKIINDTKIANSQENGGNETTDKLFLLSQKELSTSQYGFNTTINDSTTNSNDSARTRNNTDYSTASGQGTGPWWIRNGSNSSVYILNIAGRMGDGLAVTSTYMGIVPALTVPVSALPTQPTQPAQ